MNNIQAYHVARELYDFEEYVNHVSKVVVLAYDYFMKLNLSFFEDVVVACYLHDLIESVKDAKHVTSIVSVLNTNGITKEQMYTLDCLTRRTDELYFDYLRRCCVDIVAAYAKFADVNHNYQRCVIAGDYGRAKHYLKALNFITSKLRDFNESK